MGTDAIGIDVLDDKLEDYYTADFTVSWRLGASKFRLKTGVTCTSYRLDPAENGVQGCVPIIGVLAPWPS